jgi:Methyltransferase domain
MHNFVKPFVAPLMKSRKWFRICEIGSHQGETTDFLDGIPGLQVTVIDPCLDCDLLKKFADKSSIDMRKGLSLDVLPQLNEPFHCILIDGDHNWYTVYNELKLISERNLLPKGGIVFFHDVDWPWARRDMYYQPEVIPPEYRHKWEQRGIVRGKSELSTKSTKFANDKKAPFEGGKRNGVLTAVEDFLKENKREYRFFRVRAGNGLGIMQRRGEFRDDLSFLALVCKGLVFNIAAGILRLAGISNFKRLFGANLGPEERSSI